ncbi:UDP-N-acetylmuramoyl-tripeptide--D-alanyl-D-alanine ligase [Prochlorococcus marinus]|uniref:UDP-N-acetylmuramoyl-tripeptide--D-alanyl-D-alanine ligase n=1 Tax=Prochlorococcus marinus (strain MIT 9211) TaxID=93059 RepID=A9BAV9_PROM4|nr:UDP-N-acetylmuramoyl-tripeptide--D-alanyl-D-alanine ligase [Prochlorococcus marinus]ABX08971.1 UDP-N-acetylmuramoylalanyl-D-glutamyl-2, 6-diaminopimelate--D-alanyl-D-alanyl ligase [Prochlorococcus marinus str. MIT 9211]
MGIQLSELINLWGYPAEGKLSNNILGPVFTDSRQVLPGGFFVPLRGQNFDGHQFLKEACDRGAKAAVVSKDSTVQIPENLICWRVDDTLQAYQQLALLHRQRLSIPVVAVTGSVGKTTTRELITACLTTLGAITSTSDNNNNDIGVPQTILQADFSDAALILEMAMRGLGEIRRLSCCSNPDIAVITNIGNAHIGRLGSRKNIAIAKCEITTCLNPSGTVIIPAGDPLLDSILSEKWPGRIIRVGLMPLGEEHTSASYIKKNAVDLLGVLDLNNNSLSVDKEALTLPLEGMHNAVNFMLAIAVALELGISLSNMNNLHVKTPCGRNSCFTYGNLTVLDESYNSSPESVKASLDLLVTKPGRHFAVLGTMFELGDESIKFHSLIMQHAVDLSLDGVIVVSDGEEAEAMVAVGKQLPNFSIFSQPEEALPYLQSILKPGDNLLLKASRKIGLEKLLPFLENLID